MLISGTSIQSRFNNAVRMLISIEYAVKSFEGNSIISFVACRLVLTHPYAHSVCKIEVLYKLHDCMAIYLLKTSDDSCKNDK